MSKEEEKAKEYAELRYCQHCRWKDNCNYKKSCNDYNDSIKIFELGYTQAVTDISTDNTQLKEKLRESLVYIEGYASFIYNSPFGNVGGIENSIKEIKQLLNKE